MKKKKTRKDRSCRHERISPTLITNHDFNQIQMIVLEKINHHLTSCIKYRELKLLLPSNTALCWVNVS